MLALMLDPARGDREFESFGGKRLPGRYGFFEAIDYSAGSRRS